MENEAESDPVFRWDVNPEQIDLDLWAHLHVALAIEDNKRNRPGIGRFGPWPIVVLIAIGVGMVTSMTQWLLFLLYVAVIFGATKIWYRRAATSLARKLRNIPALAHGYTFFATPGGTHREGQGSTQQYDWSRWKSAWIHEHLVVLRLDMGGIELLPVAAITSGQTADDAVSSINAWIDAKRPLSAPGNALRHQQQR